MDKKSFHYASTKLSSSKNPGTFLLRDAPFRNRNRESHSYIGFQPGISNIDPVAERRIGATNRERGFDLWIGDF